MNNNAFDTLFEGFNEFDDDVMLDNTLDDPFESFNVFDMDITLDNVTPQMLIATYTGTTAADD